MRIELALVAVTLIGLILGNVFWQSLTARDWRAAADRSYWEAWALGIYALTLFLYRLGGGR